MLPSILDKNFGTLPSKHPQTRASPISSTPIGQILSLKSPTHDKLNTIYLFHDGAPTLLFVSLLGYARIY